MAQIKCDCKHDYQDKKYGVGIRIGNPLPKEKDRPQQYRCSVCEKVK